MVILENYDRISLTLKNGKISSYKDLLKGEELKSFHKRLTQARVPKVYIIKEEKEYLYVGTTKQSLTARFRQGFNASGKLGYHGYKWKAKEKVQLYVWCFPDLNKLQIESVEAEFAFLVRSKTGNWPLAQNEIHFNNEFPNGRSIAEGIFECTD